MFSEISAFLLLLVPVILIIILTYRFRLNPFFILLPSSFILGMINGVSPSNTVSAVRNGFGATIGYYGIIIIAGTAIAVIMEKTGAIISIVNTIIKYFGKEKAPAAFIFTSSALSVPCPSETGFILFSPAGKLFEKENRKQAGTITVSLAVGIYAAHALIPPSAGPLAASGILNAGILKVFITGILASTAGITAVYYWCRKFAFKNPATIDQLPEKKIFTDNELPSFHVAILPLAGVIFFIILRSISTISSRPFGNGRLAALFEFLGDPSVAILIGLFLSIALLKRKDIGKTFTGWITESIERSARILVLAGAGGALGAVLKSTSMTKLISEHFVFTGAGLLLPFLISAAIKTLSGSSTVAIITASSISASFAASAGLDPAFTVAAVASGSIVVSHANDPYFWIVSQYSDMEATGSFRFYTTATLISGVVSFLLIWIMSLLF